MPTPRPDTSVTWSAVEKPGAKISCQTSASAICSETSSPRSRALRSIFPRARPRPSSRTSMTIEPPRFSPPPLLHLGGFAQGPQFDLLAQFVGQIAQHAREAVENDGHRDHADRHHRLLQIAGVAVQV